MSVGRRDTKQRTFMGLTVILSSEVLRSAGRDVKISPCNVIPSKQNKKSSSCTLQTTRVFLFFFQVDFEKNLPTVTPNKTGTEDITFKNSVNEENRSQLPGYNPEEKSYTNMNRESRL